MANRRDKARLWVGGAALLLAGALCAAAAWSTTAAARRDAHFAAGVRLLARGIAGDEQALRRSTEAFQKAIGRLLDDRTPYVAAHVAETVGRLRAGAADSSRISPLLLAFARGDYDEAQRLSKLQSGPEARYGVRLARALAQASTEPAHRGAP